MTTMSPITLALLAIFLSYILSTAISLARNLRLAKASGLPYIVVPWYSYNRLTALLMVRVFLRQCTKYLGDPSPVSWRALVTSTWPWKHRHTPFAMLGTDTFLTVAPGGIIFQTADADVAAQVFARQADFPKASHLYKSISVYGENVVTAEGSVWRHHRKLMGSVFGEGNNQLVWRQSLLDGNLMLLDWLDRQGKAITTLAQDTMLLSLSVISRAGFSQTIQWPDELEKLPSNHTMTFTVALSTLLRNIYFIVIFPQWLLRNAPVKAMNLSYLAYLEWGRYLREMISVRRQELAQGHSGEMSNDLLTQMLRGQELPNPPNESKSSDYQLSDSDILGNLFVTIFAGHETSANSIHFSLVLLAMHPDIQRSIQVELDQLFGKSDRSLVRWNYERDLPKLLNSQLMAVLNEELRLFPPAVTIPKYTVSPQPLTIPGIGEVKVPAKTVMRICLPSLHRNPKFWPQARGDLDEFRPDRWFEPPLNESGNPKQRSWYQPPKGAYVPFSDGARACLGKRFAQVEILAVLALILIRYSVELDVSESVESKSDVGDKVDVDRLHRLWWTARDQAVKTLKDKMVVSITLQLTKGSFVPVRIVKRGEERFAGIV